MSHGYTSQQLSGWDLKKLQMLRENAHRKNANAPFELSDLAIESRRSVRASRQRDVEDTGNAYFTVRRFDDVDERFADGEREALRPLSDWQAGHKPYIGRNGGFSPNMMRLCDRFRVVEILPCGSDGGVSAKVVT